MGWRGVRAVRYGAADEIERGGKIVPAAYLEVRFTLNTDVRKFIHRLTQTYLFFVPHVFVFVMSFFHLLRLAGNQYIGLS